METDGTRMMGKAALFYPCASVFIRGQTGVDTAARSRFFVARNTSNMILPCIIGTTLAAIFTVIVIVYLPKE
jgi:hypothetical protein